MSIYRSEEMVRSQLYLQLDSAYATVSELGELGLVQFKDFNADVNAFQRKFVNEIRRCDEMERKLRYVEKEIIKHKIEIVATGDNPKAPYPREMVDMEAAFERLEGELREVNNNADALRKNFDELTELREVLLRTQSFFAQREADLMSFMDDTIPLERTDHLGQRNTGQLGFVVGVIKREKLAAFERILWFACRGNVFVRTDDTPVVISDAYTDDVVHKIVFVIFFQGEQLKTRVRKICDGYRATLYPVSDQEKERSEMLDGITGRITELSHVLEQTESHRERVLKNASKELHNWILKMRKIKAIYHTLNMCNFDMSHNSLIAEIWNPSSAMDRVNQCLLTGAEMSGSSIPPIMHRVHTTESPPTYFEHNKLTRGFQAIINAYGIGNYREINPALYSVITFPFLFAVMFGDAGHGLLMFLFALALVIYEKKIAASKDLGEVSEMFFNGRYIILLMGAFSVYTGLIYNDIYSKSCNIFGTAFSFDISDSYLSDHTMVKLDPQKFYRGDPYPFGMDPAWQVSDPSSRITYLNSLKMKMSIILGVSQMVFGLSLSLMNKIYFKNFLGIFCEFIPEILFLLSIFGYLAVLLIYKWVAYDAASSSSAPSLLIQLINMFMFKYDSSSTNPVSQRPFYSSQKSLQTFLVVLAGISAPWLLFSKPVILLIKNSSKKKYKKLSEDGDVIDEEISENERLLDFSRGKQTRYDSTSSLEQSTEASAPSSGRASDADIEKSLHSSEDEAEEFSFGDVMMHQIIHTIDYCLSCISHTASYLRLWALSLAHSELSEVFWNMVFRRGLQIDGYLGCVVLVGVWFVWAGVTIGVLLIMEGLSAFLHAMRLHWVEFQSKFYGGEGQPFLPFTFKNIHQMVLEEGKN